MYRDVDGPIKPVEDLNKICHQIPIHLILGKVDDLMYVNVFLYLYGYLQNGRFSCVRLCLLRITGFSRETMTQPSLVTLFSQCCYISRSETLHLSVSWTSYQLRNFFNSVFVTEKGAHKKKLYHLADSCKLHNFSFLFFSFFQPRFSSYLDIISPDLHMSIKLL